MKKIKKVKKMLIIQLVIKIKIREKQENYMSMKKFLKKEIKQILKRRTGKN